MPEQRDEVAESLCKKSCLSLQLKLESMLNARTDPFNLLMLASLPASGGSFRLVKGELGIKVSVRASGTDPDNLQRELSIAIQSLENSDHRLIPASGMERLVVQLRKILWRSIDTRLPYRCLKLLTRSLCFVHWKLWCRVKDTEDYYQMQLHALSYLLQEPQRITATVLRQHQFYSYWNFARRLRHLSRDNTGSRRTEVFCWSEREAYIKMNTNCKDARVLVTIHMGDFFGAFKCIADALDESRALISLRRDGDVDAIKTLSPRHAGGHRVFVHGKEKPLHIVSALRAGGHTLSVLFDLGSDFGETTEVRFFGHRARFVRGPAELAILGRARIYPFVCFSDAGRDYIRMEQAIVPAIRSGESLSDAVNRLTQSLADMAERWIRQHPAQWKYLDRLPAWLQAENAIAENAVAASEGHQCKGSRYAQ